MYVITKCQISPRACEYQLHWVSILFAITKCQLSPSARRHQNGQRLQILENKNGQGPITGNQYGRVILHGNMVTWYVSMCHIEPKLVKV